MATINKTLMVVAMLVWILSLHRPFLALASTGGWMGGSSFSSSSTSYSSGGGGGSSYGSSSSSSSYSSSYSSGGISGSNVPSMSYQADEKAIDVADDGKVESPPADDESKVEGGSISGFFLFLLGVLAVFLLFVFLAAWNDKRSTMVSTSIVKLQVCISGNIRSLQRDLDMIAEVADTSTKQGLTYVLTETTKALLGHANGCICCYSSVDVKRSMKDGETSFRKLSAEERSKVDEETMVNVNGVRRISTNTCTSLPYSKKYIVTTILVAVEGVHETLDINTTNQLIIALQKLGSLPSSKTMAVEVFWTPQKENETLTGQRLSEDYRLLKPVYII